ncbi:MAG TPA: hypothetical protein VFS37_16270, partial [Conexibacter sp.]|nr:hypothetical protein [Conexibacter sp.]
MASAASHAAVASHRGNTRASPRDSVDAATAAWLCALPLAAIVAVSILLLGPPVGGLLPRDPGATLLPSSAAGSYDESTEHARYLIACFAPFLLALATWWTVERRPQIPPRVAEIAPALAQAALAGLLIACVVAQYRIRYGAIYTRIEGVSIRERYVNPATLTAAALIAAALVLVVRNASLRARAAAFARETPARRWGALAAGALLTGV